MSLKLNANAALSDAPIQTGIADSASRARAAPHDEGDRSMMPPPTMMLVGSGADLLHLAALADQAGDPSTPTSRRLTITPWFALAESIAANDDATGLFALVSGPVEAVADALVAGESAPDALQRWAGGALALLERHRRHPERHRFIDRSDALVAPGAFLDEIALWTGWNRVVLNGLAPLHNAAIGPVIQQLCHDILRRHPDVRALCQELMVCCRPLAALPLRPAPMPDPWAALSAYWADMKAAAEADDRATEAVREQAHERQRAQHLALQLQDAVDRTKAASEQAAQAVAELNSGHVHLRALDKKRQEADTAKAALAAELKTLQRDRAEAQSAAKAARHEADLARRATEAARQEAQRAGLVAAASQQAADLARQQAESMRVQMTLDRQALAVAALGRTWAGATAERFDLIGASDLAPHRHLELCLSGLNVAARQLPRCRLRLLEHHGQPGILFFDAEDLARPLSAWRPNGDEDGEDYMLMVPGDQAGRDCLNQLGTSDWLIVDGIVRLLAWHLAQPSSGQATTRWRSVAGTLARQLALWPSRLRYDALTAAPMSMDGTGHRLCLKNAMFGDMALGAIDLLWTDPADKSTTVRWLLERDCGSPPLGSWPLGDDGAPVAGFMFPVGGDQGAADKRAQWLRLAPQERDILLGVLDALNAAGHVEGMPGRVEAEVFSKAARSLQEEARQLVGRSRKTVVRQLLQRVVPGSTPHHRTSAA